MINRSIRVTLSVAVMLSFSLALNNLGATTYVVNASDESTIVIAGEMPVEIIEEVTEEETESSEEGAIEERDQGDENATTGDENTSERNDEEFKDVSNNLEVATGGGAAGGGGGGGGNRSPEIRIGAGRPFVITVGDDFDAMTDLMVSARDREDGDVTASVVVSGDVVSTTTTGTYVVRFNVTDSDGAAAEERRARVIVVDIVTDIDVPGDDGVIEIYQSSDPADGEVFGFTGDLGVFALADTSTSSDPMFAATDLVSATYTVTQDVVAGWTLDGIVCEGGGVNVDLANRTVVISLATDETVQCFFTNSEDEVIDNGGGNTGGGGSGGGTRVNRDNDDDDTSEGEVLGEAIVCGPWLSDYLHVGRANDVDQVLRLQIFLSEIAGITTPFTGVFDDATFASVEVFQSQHYADVLMPWTEQFGFGDQPSGYVYQSTLWKINDLACPGIATFPALVPDPSV